MNKSFGAWSNNAGNNPLVYVFFFFLNTDNFETALVIRTKLL